MTTTQPASSGLSSGGTTTLGNAASNNLTDEEKRGMAWHYHGYPEFSRWMASSASDFFLLRRYSSVTARCLLSLQHQIAKKEEELRGIDLRSLEEQLGKSCLDTLEEDTFNRRPEVLEEITSLLQKYFNLVNSYSEVRSKPTAQDKHIRNLDNWFFTYPNAIEPSEQHFREHRGDLFPVLPRSNPPLATLLDKFGRIRKIFRIPKRRTDLVKDGATNYWSNTAFNQAVCTVTVVVGLGILFAPMWWLHFVENATRKLGIITAFVSLFAFWLWVAAGPKQFEILLGTAAYAAVLYIYLQASSGTSGSAVGSTAAEVSLSTLSVTRVMTTFRA